MSALRFGYVTGPILGALWLVVIATTIAIVASFGTGEAFRPAILIGLALGAVAGFGIVVMRPGFWSAAALIAVEFAMLALIGVAPIATGEAVGTTPRLS